MSSADAMPRIGKEVYNFVAEGPNSLRYETRDGDEIHNPGLTLKVAIDAEDEEDMYAEKAW